MRIGLISDTHGLMRDAALRALEGADLIIHAGDVGSPEVLEALKAVGPVAAVRGNIDTESWASKLPVSVIIQVGMSMIHVLHNLDELDFDPAAAGIEVVVSGHSHKPGRREHAGVTYINPGSAGRRRFKLPVTVAWLDMAKEPWKVEFVRLSGRR